MERFYTVCDINYAAQALCLLRSMEMWYEPRAFELRVVCCDPMTEQVFLQEPNAQVISLSFLEEHVSGLVEARMNRSWLEYLWTLPSVICSMFVSNGGSRASYLDADTYFFYHPQSLFHDTGLIKGEIPFAVVPHNWTPKYEKRLRPNGIYNVSWVSFNPTYSGELAADAWKHMCLDWCYNKIDAENQRFADQRYLEVLMNKWKGVATISPGIGLAPWNQEQYDYETIIHPMLSKRAVEISSGRRTLEDWVKSEPAEVRKTRIPYIKMGNQLHAVIFYHFHELKTDGPRIVKYTNYPVHPYVEAHIYKRYAEEYAHAHQVVQHRSM